MRILTKFSFYLLQIIDVSKATAQMFGTKVEIILPKAEPGNWATLNFPTKTVTDNIDESGEKENIVETKEPTNYDNDSDLDLDDIQQVRGVKITEA